MKLIIAEKPSVAADFAKALGATKTNGYYKSGDYTITNCIGHLLELYDPEDYNSELKQWNIKTLPIVPSEYKYKENEKTRAQLKIIKELLKTNYESIIIATDADREGELIARLVLNHCHVKGNHIMRFWSSAALTEEVIQKELKNIKIDSDYDDLYNSGIYRQRSDWLVGMNMSRLFTLRFGGPGNTFTFGRVQTALVKLVVDRHKEINNFKETFYHRLRVQSEYSGKDIYSYLLDSNNSIDFESKDLLLPMLSTKIKKGGILTVLSVNKEIKLNYAPQLFNLVNLQKTANKKYGYSAQETLDIAQTLYEKYKCLSYPRTPSRVLSVSNVDLFNEKTELFMNIYPKLFSGSRPASADNKYIFDDQKLGAFPHHALLPLAAIPENAKAEEKNVFMLVVDSLANITKNPYKYEEATVILGLDEMKFRTRGKVILDLGWKAGIEEEENESKKDDDIAQTPLPQLKIGDKCSINNVVIEDKKRTPPKPYTEANLLAAMEKYNLGTEATRASIIETIIKRDYVVRSKKNVAATDKGIYFIDSILAFSIDRLDRFLTVQESSQWESLLEKAPETFYGNLLEFIKGIIETVGDKEVDKYKGKVLAICPMCGGNMYESQNEYYCENNKLKKCSFYIQKNFSGHKLTEKEFKIIISGKETGLLEFVSFKTKNAFKASLKLNRDDKSKPVSFIFADNKLKQGARK